MNNDWEQVHMRADVDTSSTARWAVMQEISSKVCYGIQVKSIISVRDAVFGVMQQLVVEQEINNEQ